MEKSFYNNLFIIATIMDSKGIEKMPESQSFIEIPTHGGASQI